MAVLLDRTDSSPMSDSQSEKDKYVVKETSEELSIHRLDSRQFGVPEDQFEEIKRIASGYTLEGVRTRVSNVLKIHENDPNFPHVLLEKFKSFLENGDILANPALHDPFINEIKVEAALIYYNSPYAEVRGIVDNFDDPNTPCGTIRSYSIGITFAVLLAFVNQLFSIRQPAIWIGGHITQLLAYPIGTTMARYLPDWGVTVFGTRISLNPGPFSKKEHMLISIMSSVGGVPPYTTFIVWTQFLPQYFNMEYAGSFAYQICIGLGTNLIGYGLAGVCRRFLVYPAYCVWPTSLVTVSLISAFHDQKNDSVPGPNNRRISLGRLKFFLLAFALMFVYFWIPNYLFTALSMFSWMTWIAPNNMMLNAITGFNNGLGLNPLPTFDWNNIIHSGTDPLMLPFFTTLNKFGGNFISLFVVFGLWYGNAYGTGYLPLNSNRVFDNSGNIYNISRAVNKEGMFASESYEKYSPAFLSAGNLTIYIFTFAIYTATFTYAILYHHHEIKLGFIELFNSLRRGKARDESRYEDVHNRLMSAYKEVPEWWFLIVLLVALFFGILGVTYWPTNTSPLVVFYGILLCIIFIVPIGVIKSITGVEVNLAILAEFIGGSVVPGNALAMNYMKAYGFVTCSHAIWFSNDFKLAHYVKIPQRQTFTVQMLGTLISTFVSTAVLNFQMRNIPGVCTIDAPNRFTCPFVNSFVASSVLWGTIGPVKIFGPEGQYTLTLLGFPFGFALVLGFWYIKKRFKHVSWMRQVHPVVMLSGATHWAPYNISYIWPAVPLAWLSWMYVKRRFLEMWARYNYILSAGLSAGIAIAGLVMFFAVQWPNVKVDWWGNSIVYEGCEAPSNPCRLLYLKKGDYFGPRIGEFH